MIIRIISSLFVIAMMTACSSKVTTQTGKASFYASSFNGKKTASGDKFRSSKKTAAHNTIPFGTKVKVTNLSNGKSVKVKINDRGPHVSGRIIDLSRKAAKKIDMIDKGVANVKIEYKKKKK